MALPGTTKGIDGAAIPYVVPVDEFGNTAGAASGVSRIPSSANSNNATVAKASAGSVKFIDAVNTTGAVIYLKLYNKATAPAPATDNALLMATIALPANSSRNVDLGIAFSAGISYALVTGASDTDNTSVGAGAVVGLNVAYS
jgi:hypothetical protein